MWETPPKPEILCGLLGAVFVVFGLMGSLDVWRFFAAGVDFTRGKVVDWVAAHPLSGHAPNHYPVVRFPVDKRMVTITGRFKVSTARYSLGEEVRVYYPRGAPEKGRIANLWEFLTFPLFFGMGTLGLLVALAIALGWIT